MRRRYNAVVVVVFVAAVGACNGDGGDRQDPSTSAASTSPPSSPTHAIEEAVAVELAVAEVQRTDPDFDPGTTRPVVVLTDDGYDVGFPDTDSATLNGEPHVVIDADTGEVVETYRTR